jgi:hypothetical protein
MADRSLRIGLGAVGIVLIGYGALRLAQAQPTSHLLAIAKWLIGALIVHDAILSPIVIAIGWLLTRYVPKRIRGFVQAGVVAAALVASVGVFLIWRQGKYGAKSLALLQQHYLPNLLILFGGIAVVTVAAYVTSTAVNSRNARSNRTKARPPADQ